MFSMRDCPCSRSCKQFPTLKMRERGFFSFGGEFFEHVLQEDGRVVGDAGGL